MVRASGILRRIVVPVEKNWHPTDGPRPRGAKAVIDESTAARLSAVVGDGEFSEFAGVAHGAPEDSATTTAALIRRNTPAAAIAVATLACLWVGNRMNQSLPDTVAHAGADGGSFGEPTAAAGPMFGAGRDLGARGGDPAMNLKNSARVAVLAVTAAVTANGALAGDAVQWRVEDGGNGHWYQLTTPPDRINVGDAATAAIQRGGDLASVGSTAENQFVFVLAAATPSLWTLVWTGATQISGPWIGAHYVDGAWQWRDRNTWNFANWSPGNPNYLPGESAVLYMGEANGPPTNMWNNMYPYYLNWGYVIEWSADCNSDGIVDYGQCHDGTLPDYNGNNIPDCCEQGVQCTVGNYSVQWRVEDGGNGHWYRFIPVNLIGSWSSANEAAGQVGGHLATITAPAELGFVELLSACVGCPGWGPSWAIGGIQNQASPTYAEPAGGWQWVTGENWSWSPWAPGEPNNSGGSEDFLYLHCNLHGCNDGGDSSNGCVAAIIEWSADCNSDGIVDYGQILNGQLADTNTNGIPDCCEPGNSCCIGDIYENHIVDGGDLGILLSEWGVVMPTTNSDLNRDGFVNGADLGMLLANWGPCGG